MLKIMAEAACPNRVYEEHVIEANINKDRFKRKVLEMYPDLTKFQVTLIVDVAEMWHNNLIELEKRDDENRVS